VVLAVVFTQGNGSSSSETTTGTSGTTTTASDPAVVDLQKVMTRLGFYSGPIRDGVAAEYALVPARVLAPKPARLSHVEAAALPMGGLTAWQALFVHGRLARGERVLVTGTSGGVGHIAVQLARHAGAEVVESGPVDLVFDTRGGEVPAGERVVTIVEEVPGATYFVVEPDHEQLLELGALVDAGELRPEVDSVFPAHGGPGGVRAGCRPREAGQGRARGWQWLAAGRP
jgi:hypothetical protein